MGKPQAPDQTDPARVISETEARTLLTQTPDPGLTIPAIDRRTGYLAKRAAIVDTSLLEGEKLHALGCVRRGFAPSHFVFRAPNGAKTRHDVHVTLDVNDARTFWDALVCSCPTGRHAGDPCWHKGAVRAFLADNEHVRHANRLLSLPLT